MKDIVKEILIELLQLTSAFVTLVLSRWLLGLSSPEQDRRWLHRQPWYQTLKRLKWYRGNEIIHQLRGMYVLQSTRS